MKQILNAMQKNSEDFVREYAEEFSQLAERHDKFGLLRAWMPGEMLVMDTRPGLILVFDHALVRVSANWVVLDTWPLSLLERSSQVCDTKVPKN